MDKVCILVKILAESHMAFDLLDNIDIQLHTDRPTLTLIRSWLQGSHLHALTKFPDFPWLFEANFSWLSLTAAQFF